MIGIVLTRLAGVIPVLLLVSLVIFGLLRLAPGDAADMLVSADASQEEVAQARVRWGLDQPLPLQYLKFVGAMARFDFGASLRYHDDVFRLILQRMPATLELAAVAVLLASLVALPLGVLAAVRKGGFIDNLVSITAIAGVSAPTFWLGILLVLFISGVLKLLPSSGRFVYGTELASITGFTLIDVLLAGRLDLFWESLSYIILPATTLALNMMGIITRVTRSAVIDVAQEDFVSTVVAKGCSRTRVILRHLVPNALIPVTTIVGLELGALISGSIIVEVVFSWPGMGTLLYQAINVRDIPLTAGIVVVYTFLFILINILIDLAYLLIDPRVRASQTA